MDVIILAGGLGTRLRPVVSDVPKCMALVSGNPFLHYIFRYLEHFDFVENVILSVGYKHEMIMDWVIRQRELPFKIAYSVENEPLGTGGAIKEAVKHTKNKAIAVFNGDTFFDVDLKCFSEEHNQSGMILSVALKPMVAFERYGNVEINHNNIITAFQEKKHCEKGLINGGIYLINKTDDLLGHLPQKFSFEKEVLEPWSEAGRVSGFEHLGYFIDIGIPEDYEKANNEFQYLFANQ